MIVGYLIKGGFICTKCLPDASGHYPVAVPVLTENIGQYRQSCPVCQKVVVEGKFDSELFEPAKDPRMFDWHDMDVLMNGLTQAKADDDSEAYDSILRTLYERVLRAIIAGKLQDENDVFDALRRILS